VPAPAPDAPEKPLGLIDLWRVRLSFVYWFEKRRLRTRKDRTLRFWIPFLASVFLVLLLFNVVKVQYIPGYSSLSMAASRLGARIGSQLLSAALNSWLYIPTLLIHILTVMATVMCARTFAAERDSGTLDALMMTSIPRARLVAARYFGVVAPFFWVCFVWMGCLVLKWSFLSTNRFVSLPLLIAYYGVSLIHMYAMLCFSGALGIWAGLRFQMRETPLFAGAATTLLVLTVPPCMGVATLYLVEAILSPEQFPPNLAPMYLLVMACILAVSAVWMLLAFFLLRRAAHNFDAWATRD